ncbi:hypothetical protein TCON_0496 [Astathelohania contejeani]|uniref:Uncharacterized protein n=1 Tax=Astathelohania contejeani TaxID=164912 RepID=A0ABQ7I1L6_9MICR|nr:hypothetical protein TCON_0496 [Thelohania contejeani]
MKINVFYLILLLFDCAKSSNILDTIYMNGVADRSVQAYLAFGLLFLISLSLIFVGIKHKTINLTVLLFMVYDSWPSVIYKYTTEGAASDHGWLFFSKETCIKYVTFINDNPYNQLIIALVGSAILAVLSTFVAGKMLFFGFLVIMFSLFTELITNNGFIRYGISNQYLQWVLLVVIAILLYKLLNAFVNWTLAVWFVISGTGYLACSLEYFLQQDWGYIVSYLWDIQPDDHPIQLEYYSIFVLIFLIGISMQTLYIIKK